MALRDYGAASLMSARSGSVVGLGKTRVEALTDGIFGAVMTVLGLSLTILYITGPAHQALPALEDVVTGVLTYALSFVTLGVFWVGHHVGFQVVKRTDRTFIWLNNVFLLFVGLLPLTTALLGHHPFEEVTVVAYGLNLLAIQVFMFLTLWYATLHHHLVDAGLNDRFIWLGRRRMLLGPCFSMAGILLSFPHPLLRLRGPGPYPLFFITPGRIARISRPPETK